MAEIVEKPDEEQENVVLRFLIGTRPFIMELEMGMLKVRMFR